MTALQLTKAVVAAAVLAAGAGLNLAALVAILCIGLGGVLATHALLAAVGRAVILVVAVLGPACGARAGRTGVIGGAGLTVFTRTVFGLARDTLAAAAGVTGADIAFFTRCAGQSWVAAGRVGTDIASAGIAVIGARLLVGRVAAGRSSANVKRTHVAVVLTRGVVGCVDTRSSAGRAAVIGARVVVVAR